MSTLLVTGASGNLGNLAAKTLLASNTGHKIIAASRNPSKLADLAALGAETRALDFEDAATLASAFAGVDRALIVSTDALDKPGRRIAQHKNAIDAAAKAGVKHVVYTSFTHSTPDSVILLAPDHYATEQLLDQSPLGYTILRNNLYAEILLSALSHAVATGQWFAAAGNGAIGYVPRADAATAAAAALASSFDGRRTLDITGPAALTHQEVAAIVSEIIGKPLAYIPVDEAAVTQGLVGAGFPEPMAKIFASFDTATAKGELNVVSSAVEDLTGRRPQSLRDFLATNKAALG
jgi:NAD(P)H dehydrogenase (quinone)